MHEGNRKIPGQVCWYAVGKASVPISFPSYPPEPAINVMHGRGDFWLVSGTSIERETCSNAQIQYTRTCSLLYSLSLLCDVRVMTFLRVRADCLKLSVRE